MSVVSRLDFRMETTSSASRIQVSEETAKLLIEAGKVDWVTPRTGTVSVKGKGEMTTYWLQSRGYARSSHDSCDDTRTVDEFSAMELPHLQKTDRLIKWNVEIMLRLLKKIHSRSSARPSSTMNAVVDESHNRQQGPVVGEAVEVIRLPKFSKRSVQQPEKPLGPEIEQELTAFVGSISAMYGNSAFHGFEHASHVVMSVAKLLSRIVAPSDLEMKDGHGVDSLLHDTTFGITSDPLTQFSVVFSALIHDAGHTGVPNTQVRVTFFLTCR
jgi:Adenylate and Guanylate cyclase catalytic domain